MQDIYNLIPKNNGLSAKGNASTQAQLINYTSTYGSNLNTGYRSRYDNDYFYNQKYDDSLQQTQEQYQYLIDSYANVYQNPDFDPYSMADRSQVADLLSN